MKKSELKALIREILQDADHMAGSDLDNWITTLQTTRISNISVSNDGRCIVLKLVDGGVAKLESNTPIRMSPIIRHTN